MLSFYPQFWTQAFDFEGRTSRIDYWKIVLVNLIIGGVLLKVSPSAVYLEFAVASISTGLEMNIKRIPDTSHSWQWIFIFLFPLVGVLWIALD